MSSTRIVYTPRPDTTPEAELDTLAAIYRFLLLEKGDRHDLTENPTPKTVKNGSRTKEQEKT
jgi:hypothetical protein